MMSAFCVMLAVAAAVTDQLPFPAYVQEIEVRFANPADVAKAKVAVAPLPDNAEVAVCSRWDDSNPKQPKAAGKVRIDAWGSEGAGVEAAYLNGKEYPLKDTATLAVSAGRNRLIIRAYRPPPLGRNFRSFSLLVTDAKTGVPVKTLPIER